MTDAAPAPAAPGPAAPAAGAGDFLLSAAAGVAVLAACGDLLVAVLLGLRDAPAGDAIRWTTRDLGYAIGGASLAAFALAAAVLRGGAGALLLAAGGHALVATGLWFAAAAAGPLPRGFLLPVLLHLLSSGLAAAAAGVPARSPGARAAAGRGAAENLESILVAIVFALAIRHYAVEAYKIPTESMAPTLYGESGSRGPGDRVLVTKAPALLGGPGRWEVWVFRPPLDRTINYVKRVAGLPGETVEIVEGDLVVDGKVARKPPKVREALWFPVWPRPDGAAEPKPPWSGEGFVKEGEGGFRVRGATEPRLLEYGPPIQDGVFLGRSGANAVGDVRLRFRVEDAEPGTVVLVRIAGRAGVCEARVDASGNSIHATRDGAPASLSLPPGSLEKTGNLEELEFSFADLRWELRFNGGDPRTLDAESPAVPAGRKPGNFGVSFGVAKGGARFTSVRLDRDVHYTGSYRFQVPEGHYLFLGDNSAASQDSRMWAGHEIREIGGAGRVFYAAERPRAAGEDGRVVFKDRNGVVRSFAPAEIAISEGRVPLSFVPAEDLHGRAFAIFWPPRWFTKVPGGRLGLLP